MKHDLDPCDLEPLIAGSARARNAMQESTTRTPPCSLCIVITVLIVAAAAFVAWTWYVAGPPPFFNWSK